MNGDPIDTDWTGTLATGSVVLTDLNANVAPRVRRKPSTLPRPSWKPAPVRSLT